MSRLSLALTLCALSLSAAKPPAKPIPDRNLGLSRTSVFDVPAPPAYRDEASDPGEKPLPKRINREYPPVITTAWRTACPSPGAPTSAWTATRCLAPRRRARPRPFPPATSWTSVMLPKPRAPRLSAPATSAFPAMCLELTHRPWWGAATGPRNPSPISD